jgi:hypothetical protein
MYFPEGEAVFMMLVGENKVSRGRGVPEGGRMKFLTYQRPEKRGRA